jgi:hypothetical protein
LGPDLAVLRRPPLVRLVLAGQFVGIAVGRFDRRLLLNIHERASGSAAFAARSPYMMAMDLVTALAAFVLFRSKEPREQAARPIRTDR